MEHAHDQGSAPTRAAIQATLHCLTGCAIGEILGMVLSAASDTVSIATMELVDNAFFLLVPGAIAAGLADGLFWWSLLVSLAIAFVLTVPVNRWLIVRGRGHAVMHELHAH